VYALHDLYMKLYSFNLTYTMVMKSLLQSMNFFKYIAHIACLVLLRSNNALLPYHIYHDVIEIQLRSHEH